MFFTWMQVDNFSESGIVICQLYDSKGIVSITSVP